MHAAMNAVVWVIMVSCGLRLCLAGATGLGIDESYMVAASHQFAASYFDHPLASWWLELGSRALFGNDSPLVVRLPFVLLSALSSGLIFLITNRLYGSKAGFWAAAAYNVSPVFSLAFGCWVLPDGPLDAALLAMVYALLRALGLGGGAPKPPWWLAAGLFAGLALLSKYSAALVLAGGVMAILSDPASRRALATPMPWLAAFLAALLASPILVWNAGHGWVSFGYQGGRALGVHLHPLAPLIVLAGEALFLLPWLWLPLMICLVSALRRGPADRPAWLLACLALPPVFLFALVGGWSSTRILYHWAAPGYLMLFPLLGAWLAGFRWRGATIQISGTLLAGGALILIMLPNSAALARFETQFPPGKSPFPQLVDWDSIAADMPPEIQAVACQRWFDAGKIGYALRGRGLPVTVFGPEPHEFGITTPPSSLLGKNILLTAMPGDVSDLAKSYSGDFKTIKPGPALVVSHDGVILLVIPTLIGMDLRKTP